ncbi:MAG TPA: ABC transporter ATP-binding protein [candidate division Zixibacteria bacterium]|jgi:phospholipid/cholesterol/gamma-HCH transport system ATP-binding protein
MIAIRALSKSFDGRRVLDGVDLDVERGETMVVIGRSGCGKSVLLKHVVGLLTPDSGEVAINGVTIGSLLRNDLYRLRLRFGFLFQSGALLDSMTVAQNVGLGLGVHAVMLPAEIADRVAERLAWVGLEQHADKFPSQLSGGMRKRASLARAIAMDPEIVLYDEPTTGLDPITAEGINDLLVALRERLHVTAIAVTHDMRSAFKIGDRVAMLHGGRIAFCGTVDEAKTVDNPIVRQFVSGDTSGPLEPL